MMQMPFPVTSSREKFFKMPRSSKINFGKRLIFITVIPAASFSAILFIRCDMQKSYLEIFDSPLLEVFYHSCLQERFPEHFHDHFVVGCLLSGARIYRCNGSLYRLAPGQIIFINPGDVHQCASAGLDSSWLAVHMPLQSLKCLVPDSETAHSLRLPTRPFMDTHIFYSLLDLARKRGGIYATRLLKLICKKFLPVGDHILKRAKPDLPQWNSMRTQILDAGRNMNLDEMSAQMNMNKFAFAKKFREMAGISPYRFQQIYRLNLARAEIMNTSIGKCAQQLGFYDQSHLNRQFRENFGFTPGCLKKAWIKSRKIGNEK